MLTALPALRYRTGDCTAATAVKGTNAAVTVVGRDAAKAEALARELGCAVAPWDQIGELNWDALVHATPVGSLAAPGELPFPAEWIREGTLVLDCVYRPIRTPLLVEAKKRGCTPVPGGEWFVRQAREQFRLFTNTEPDESLLRAAFEAALEAESDAPSGSGTGTGAGAE